MNSTPAEHPASILVVDDNRGSLRLLAGLLLEQGFRVHPVISGEAALAVADAEPPDLVLLDVHMPGIDGYEVCRRLKANERTAGVPVIFLSAADETINKVQAFTVGGVDFVTKPYKAEEVLARIDAQLRLYRLQACVEAQNRALQAEIVERERAEAALVELNQRLEGLVAERTADLTRANSELKVEVAERLSAEAALRESEQKYRSIVWNAPVGIFRSTPEGRFLEVNSAMATLFGYPSTDAMADDIDGFGADLFVRPEEHRLIVDELRRTGRVKQRTNSYRRRDGTEFVANLYLATLDDETGSPRFLEGIVEDITERKRAEAELVAYRDHLEELVEQRTRELAQAKEAAEMANRAKSLFLANMSHELRTPLNVILGFSSLMRRDARMAGRDREHLDIINRGGSHLLGLINDILDMAKIEAGRVQLESVAFDLDTLVNDVVGMMDQRALEKGVDLRLERSARTIRYVRGDETRLRQVLVNLLGNAIKFTPQGSVTLRLDTLPGPNGPRLSIEVEDSGPGIASGDQARIFDPFVQVGQPAAQQGTGLGLAITRQFVELMGGRIDVSSQPGRGSCFRVELPAEPASESEVLAEQDEGGDVMSLAPGQTAYRILIVEDQPESALLLSRLLEEVGFQVQCADNGLRGVESFQHWRPQLIWMDLRMPKMNGLEATRRIRALPGGREVKIVAVTASVFAEERREILAAGMDDILHKPYRPSEIFECLSRQLGVRYLCHASDAARQTPLTLDPAALAALPEDLRRQFTEALVVLDIARIEALIGRVAEVDAAMAKVLRHHADRYDYTAIEAAFREAA